MTKNIVRKKVDILRIMSAKKRNLSTRDREREDIELDIEV